MRLYLYYVGKARDPRANALAEEYIRRISHYARCEMTEAKPGRTDWWTRNAAARKILLDPAGKPMNSDRFADLVAVSEREARDLLFVVGGAEGLPEEWRKHGDMLLSLSPMTFPHELARVMLTEQIYRAFARLRGHPYPK